MSDILGLEASAGLRHLDIANARLRKRETQEWVATEPAFLERLRRKLAALAATAEWLEGH
jgi:hypothetical protein